MQRGRGRGRGDARNPAARAMNSRRGAVLDRRQAAQQSTVNDLMHSAEDLAHVTAPQRTVITDRIISRAELELVRRKRRDEFEVLVKRHWRTLSQWIEYARWEAQQHDESGGGDDSGARVRAIFERALAAKHNTRPALWREYAEFEAAGGRVERARAVWERALRQLPQAADLWLKALALEFAAHSDTNIRDLFNRWLCACPPPCAWKLFVNFEAARHDVDAARQLLRRFVEQHNTVDAWLFYCSVEADKFFDTLRARQVAETALRAVPDPARAAPLYALLAQLCERDGDVVAARAAYRDALTRVHDSQMEFIMAPYARLERRCGSPAEVDFLTNARCHTQYAARVAADPTDYVAWASRCLVAVREGRRKELLAYLREAARHHPPSRGGTAQQWAPYLYLCIWLARAEEEEEEEGEGEKEGEGKAGPSGGDAARAALRRALNVVPHRDVDASALWIAAAELEERCGAISSARALLGEAIGVQPREAVLAFYAELERRNGDFARLRKVLELTCTHFPRAPSSWLQLAAFEEKCDEHERAVAALELGLSRVGNAPNAPITATLPLWGALVLSKLRRGDDEGAAATTERLAEFAIGEALQDAADASGPAAAAEALSDAEPLIRGLLAQHASLCLQGCRAGPAAGAEVARVSFARMVEGQRGRASIVQAQVVALLLDAWRNFEREHGTEATLRAVDEVEEAPTKQRRRLFQKAAGPGKKVQST